MYNFFFKSLSRDCSHCSLWIHGNLCTLLFSNENISIYVTMWIGTGLNRNQIYQTVFVMWIMSACFVVSEFGTKFGMYIYMYSWIFFYICTKHLLCILKLQKWISKVCLVGHGRVLLCLHQRIILLLKIKKNMHTTLHNDTENRWI